MPNVTSRGLYLVAMVGSLSAAALLAVVSVATSNAVSVESRLTFVAVAILAAGLWITAGLAMVAGAIRQGAEEARQPPKPAEPSAAADPARDIGSGGS